MLFSRLKHKESAERVPGRTGLHFGGYKPKPNRQNEISKLLKVLIGISIGLIVVFVLFFGVFSIGNVVWRDNRMAELFSEESDFIRRQQYVALDEILKYRSYGSLLASSSSIFKTIADLKDAMNGDRIDRMDITALSAKSSSMKYFSNFKSVDWGSPSSISTRYSAWARSIRRGFGIKSSDLVVVMYGETSTDMISVATTLQKLYKNSATTKRIVTIMIDHKYRVTDPLLYSSDGSDSLPLHIIVLPLPEKVSLLERHLLVAVAETADIFLNYRSILNGFKLASDSFTPVLTWSTAAHGDDTSESLGAGSGACTAVAEMLFHIIESTRPVYDVVFEGSPDSKMFDSLKSGLDIKGKSWLHVHSLKKVNNRLVALGHSSNSNGEVGMGTILFSEFRRDMIVKESVLERKSKSTILCLYEMLQISRKNQGQEIMLSFLVAAYDGFYTLSSPTLRTMKELGIDRAVMFPSGVDTDYWPLLQRAGSNLILTKEEVKQGMISKKSPLYILVWITGPFNDRDKNEFVAINAVLNVMRKSPNVGLIIRQLYSAQSWTTFINALPKQWNVLTFVGDYHHEKELTILSMARACVVPWKVMMNNDIVLAAMSTGLPVIGAPSVFPQEGLLTENTGCPLREELEPESVKVNNWEWAKNPKNQWLKVEPQQIEECIESVSMNVNIYMNKGLQASESIRRMDQDVRGPPDLIENY